MWQKSDSKGGKSGKDGKHGKGSKGRGRDQGYRDDYGRPPWEEEAAEDGWYRGKGKGKNYRGGDYQDGYYEERDRYSKEPNASARSDARGGGKRGYERVDRGGGKRSDKGGRTNRDDNLKEEAQGGEASVAPPTGQPLNSSAAAFQPSGMFGNLNTQSLFGGQHVVRALWEEYSTEEGTKYYYNSRTGLTQWEKPPELDPPKLAAVEAKPEFAQASEGKEKEFTERGRSNRDQDKDDTRKGGGRGERGDRDRGGRRVGDGEDGDRGNARRNKKRLGASGEDKDGKNRAVAKDGSEFGPPGCNLFVFHLPDDWTDEELNEYFSPHGTVISAKVMKELGTGRSRGFGFVSYEDRVSAATAIKKMQGLKILGKRLKVEFKKGEGDSALSDIEDPLGDDEEGSKRNCHDDERLIGYLRAISAKNVVESLRESENAAKGVATEPSENTAQGNAAEPSGEADLPLENGSD
eukprot:TRINITY_DN2095_c0_g2_i1.p1 TRINITY_DN2095_c0_g2~~TRINITY_DN2095_c0_g2_i1.p1  ORF type:complete len:464 (-),score=102.83 TRINITY_DN2095_c0_g2_i1:88-1479(-)